jgi:glycosyltransferase involved in cell wall biosynthesis
MAISSIATGSVDADRAAKRVMFVMNTPVVGGAERHTFELASALHEGGWQPTVFAMKSGSLPPPKEIDLFQPAAPRRLFPRIADLAEAIRTVAPDLIVAVNERPVLAAVLARLQARRRMPIVAISHSTVLRNRKEEWMQRIYTPLFNRIEGVVFISQNQRRFWRERGFRPRDEVTILNGIDLDRFSPDIRALHREGTRREFGFAPTDFVIGLCAVMRPEKNHLQIVEAISRLRQQGVPARALLVGDGPMRRAVEERAAALGVAEHVVLAGMHGDVRPFIAAFDVGVLCSVSIETLSLAALETMAMGIPMVMSELGGASEVVDANTGRLFPVGDMDRLCQALMSLTLEDVRIKAGEAARRKVKDIFNYRDMVRSYSSYFSSLVS